MSTATESDPPPTPASWVPSWFRTSPLRSSLKDRSHKKVASVVFEDSADANPSVRRNRGSGVADSPDKSGSSVSFPLKERSSGRDGGTSSPMEAPADSPLPKREESKRRTKAAPPVPGKIPLAKATFTYDTLKERADTWKKERDKRSFRSTLPETAENPTVSRFHERGTLKPPEMSHEGYTEDNHRPKICFTKEESDKVDKDILRLMDALEQNRYPFNRDKHILFNKLRLIRRKQMGLLFAHRELDSSGYFNTNEEVFGYDKISDKVGIMYNVIDAISRDVYELRELLYYERKNQTPPNRRGSSDRRSSSEPPVPVKPSMPPRKLTLDHVDSPQVAPAKPIRSSSSKPWLPSPTKPILKHSLSVESFKSAKSDDTITD